ncbi:translation elongation factor Ts [Pelagibacteraceae bacterium]|nr:translation elongation factor Ts [Pelagibacteraceae bacterium]
MPLIKTFFDNKNGENSFYLHGALELKIGKIVSIVKISKKDSNEIGKKIAMHISAMSPMGLEEKNLSKELVDKEIEIIKAELLNSGKQPEIVEKISKGKINKFISDNTLLNQIWIMDSKKKVSEVLKENDIKVVDFIRYKVGEGV